ncbi:OadG family transporter subunit [uncultured Fretibacterium sp.]|uniref:OadG family transporter subunit n=1 Tax=uncultured Fretibacterium sp. TaxID=1678694 RepID=UPI00260BDB4C|nr:OadG family transporter subunit [uncultured Fretibacterium sp.]
MNPSAAPAAFEGVSGSITVSITAFTIVFAVLAGLTAVIYAIKIFAGEDVGPAAASASPLLPGGEPAPSAPVAPAPRAAGVDRKVVAAITAAVLAATGGRGRVLSVVPERGAEQPSRWTRTWRTAALIEGVGNRLSRPWK